MAEVSRWLEEQGAHHDVVAWARPYADRWEQAWNECPRGDWLLGIAAGAGVQREPLVNAACACARFALDYLPEGELRPGAAIDAAEGWAKGGDRDERAARRAQLETEAAAVIQSAPDPAVAAAATAALAALRTINAPGEAPLVVTSAVQAALLDVGECAMMSAAGYAQSTCADLVREHISHALVRASFTSAPDDG